MSIRKLQTELFKNTTREEAGQFYQELRSKPVEFYSSNEFNVTGDDVGLPHLDKTQAKAFISICAKSAHKIKTEDAFYAALKDVDIPAIRMTPQEMELIRGGNACASLGGWIIKKLFF